MADNHDLPDPRFSAITELFDEIDEVLAKKDEKYHLTLFEFEILVLMLKKKIEQMGIIAMLGSEEEHTHTDEGKGNPEPYK
jgi:hypothetical protein